MLGLEYGQIEERDHLCLEPAITGGQDPALLKSKTARNPSCLPASCIGP